MILLIIGSILFIIGGLLYLAMRSICKNQETWDAFWKMIQESDDPRYKQLVTFPE